MSDYLPVPVGVARGIAHRYAKTHVVIVSYDPEHQCTHTTTYGQDPNAKIEAARMGEVCTLAIVGSLEGVRSHEDFRLVDAAERAAAIERLHVACKAADHLLGSLLAVRDGVPDCMLISVRSAIAKALGSSLPKEHTP